MARSLHPSASRSASRIKKKAAEEAQAAEEAAMAAAKTRAEANRQMLNDLQKSMLAGGRKVLGSATKTRCLVLQKRMRHCSDDPFVGLLPSFN